jgi:hypothetical protein
MAGFLHLFEHPQIHWLHRTVRHLLSSSSGSAVLSERSMPLERSSSLPNTTPPTELRPLLQLPPPVRTPPPIVILCPLSHRAPQPPLRLMTPARWLGVDVDHTGHHTRSPDASPLWRSVSPVWQRGPQSPQWQVSLMHSPKQQHPFQKFSTFDSQEPHLMAMKRIMRYLQGTLDYGLLLCHLSSFYLITYTEADWAGCPDTHRSTSGYAVFLSDNLVSWSAKW